LQRRCSEMIDLLLIAITIAAFAVGFALVRGFERI
jgi:hypothetical protein